MRSSSLCGPFSVSQTTGAKNLPLTHSYDLVFVAVSWERRATSAMKVVQGTYGTVHVLKFKSTNTAVETVKVAQVAELRAICKAGLEVVELSESMSFDENSSRLESILTDKYRSLRRPLKVLLDISCIPKSYSLFILGCGFDRGFLSRLDCIYSEGDYSSIVADSGTGFGPVGLVSSGEWTSWQIPCLGAESAIPKNRDLIVALGGEIALSVPFIEKYEPRQLLLGVISEGIIDKENRGSSEENALNALKNEPNVEAKEVSVSDAVGFLECSLDFVSKATAETISCLALGSKPHALALGLIAHASRRAEVICRIPASYRFVDVPPSGVYAMFEIEDRFEPTAYF